MCRPVQWLNDNGGFVMAMLTAAYVGTTLIMAKHMSRANKLASDSLALVAKLEGQRSRPYLVFDLESRRKIVTAVLRNIGKTPAYNVKVAVSPALEHSDTLGNKALSLVTGAIRMVAPSREFTDVVDSGPAFYQRYETPRFTGAVSYEDSEGTQYEESFDIDMTFEATLLKVQPPPDVGGELEKIREWLKGRFRA